ncbi:bifunctional diaminohydroxyphosphoribosylaminopyrimidine deaminase/5-amino-6-(5-phosphoribosylamino)uracil reductase RibD, partial [Chloroflexota bacterium]
PLIYGRGIREMEVAGIKTFFEECEQAVEINEAYAKYITHSVPFVTAKFAMSLDGKVATKSGDSKWISGEESRRYVHCLRYVVDAIMVGVDTVIADDPRLTARAGKEGGRAEKQPLRVIVDSRARTPLDAQVFRMPGKTLIAVIEDVEPAKIRALSEAGADILCLPSKDGRVDLEELLIALGRREVANILVEGGATLFGSLFDQGLVDKLLAFIAPIIIGGGGAKSPVEGRGVGEISKAINLSRVAMERFGDDMLIKGYIKENRCSPVLLKK